MGFNMLRNGRELLAPGNIDCEPWSEREEDNGLVEDFGGDDMFVAFKFILPGGAPGAGEEERRL